MRVLGAATGAGGCPSSQYSQGRARSARKPGVDAARVGLQHRALLRGSPARRPARATLRKRNRRALRSCSSATRAEQLRTAPRRPGAATGPSRRSGPARAGSRSPRRGRRGCAPRSSARRAHRALMVHRRGEPAGAHAAPPEPAASRAGTGRRRAAAPGRAATHAAAEVLQHSHGAARSRSVEGDLQDLHRVGAALHARRLALGEDHQVVASSPAAARAGA